MILYAVLALASRFDCMATGSMVSGSTCDLESTYYQSRCIKLLITSLSRPPEEYDTNLLIAVLVSSLYEETQLYQETTTHHLKGARNLLSSGVISRLARQGGLAEAACWVHLRQTIYVSLSRRKRLDIPLSVYEGLPAFDKDDDSSYANRVIYLFAKALDMYFGESSRLPDSWSALEDELRLWYLLRPDGSRPLFHEVADAQDGRPFPSLWMMTMTQGTFTFILMCPETDKPSCGVAILLCEPNYAGPPEEQRSHRQWLRSRTRAKIPRGQCWTYNV